MVDCACKICGKQFSYPVLIARKRKREVCDDCKKKKQKYGEVLVVKEEVKKKKGFEGLWKGRSGWYRSKAFKKKDIANLLLGNKDRKCIILRYNKYHKPENNTPNFIFAFADAREADRIVEDLPFQTPDGFLDDEEGNEKDPGEENNDASSKGSLDDMLNRIPSDCRLEDMEYGFSFSSYQNLLAEVKFGVDERMKTRVYTQFIGGEFKEEPHYIAVVFPNGDELHRFDNVRGEPYSAIYVRGDNELIEMWRHYRECELGMVIWYLENRGRE